MRPLKEALHINAEEVALLRADDDNHYQTCITMKSYFILLGLLSVPLFVLSTDSQAQSSQSLEAAAQQWAAVAAEQAAAGSYSGGVHLSRGGDVILEQFWGHPVKGEQASFDRDTRFNVASMGKMFTAVAVGQLVEEGKLNWTDAVGKHFPDFPWTEYADQITIEQLLSHQSGLGGYGFDHGLTDVESIVEFASSEPVAFEPGSEMGYSNTGYAVLGVIIERVSGMDYYDYIRENVFGRAGMMRSGFFSVSDPVDNMALGYTLMQPDGTQDGGERTSNANMIERIGSPGGGAYSTLADMQRFGQALLNDELLSSGTREELWRRRAQMGPGMWYALGFGNHDRNGMQVVGHNGGAPGIGADFKIFPETGVVAVAFTNFDPRPIMSLSRELTSVLASVEW
jgi:CubicO group peptidase (beta-lactamase class C family)